ncbi:MAG: PAS domain S-box protein, partial [Candidatus Zixiibacteriota bacterium]
HATLDNVLFAPLISEGKAVGLLGLANKPGGFSQDDARIASAFGELAAVALQNSRTLEELEHSEERFRSVAQTANDAVITVDRTGNIVFWNRAAEITFGYSFDEVMGKPLTLIVPERFHRSHQEGMKHVLSTGETKLIGKTVEMAGLKRDESEFPLELSIATWKSGEEVFFTGILRDITERKRAEQALRESEEKFRGLAEQSPNMIFINRKGRVVYANRRCEEVMGYKREEFYSPDFDFLEMVMPESRDLVRENFSKHARGEDVHPYEYTLRTREGKRIEAILNSELVTYGGEAAILGIVTDITERKLVEEELRKRTYDLGERVKELNCLYNIGKLIETPDMSLEQIFQGTVELIPPAWQFPEITCARLVTGDRVFATSNFRETIWKQTSDITVHSDREGALEVYYLEERPESDEGPFLAEERSLLEAIVERLGRVIERKRAEEEIQKLNESLKVHAAELAAANKELEAFSYSVSHDLRAPLRTIDGFSRALLEDYDNKLGEQGKDYLNRVRAASQRMGHLIDDLLNLSLMMRREMRREETDLSDLARSIAAELRKTQPRRQAEFVIQEGVVARGDPRLLREVLENLLGNAWKFTEKHSRPRIEFGASQQEEQSAYFVRDNGAGFDMAYADKLFVPFQRLHSTAEFSGNGIGLTIASRIINRHGGRIWAEGELEKGATFYFTLK